VLGWNELDHDAAVFDPLDRLIARGDLKVVPDRLLDRDLASFSYPTWHG
jgi:hypothetical protein